MKQMKKTMLAALCLPLMLGACATQGMGGMGMGGPELQGPVYKQSEMRSEQSVKTGKVVSVRPVIIEKDASMAGAAGGAIVGAVIGSQVGGGKGRVAAGALGALAGGMAGNALEKNYGKIQGQEVTVQFSDGTQKAYVQPEQYGLGVGQKVRVQQVNGEYRVVPQ